MPQTLASPVVRFVALILISITILVAGCAPIARSGRGRVLDVSGNEPTPVANAWVRVDWIVSLDSDNPVQPTSSTRCERVEVVQTDKDGYYEIQKSVLLPWRWRPSQYATTLGSRGAAVYAADHIPLLALLKDWNAPLGKASQRKEALAVRYPQLAKAIAQMQLYDETDSGEVWLVRDPRPREERIAALVGAKQTDSEWAPTDGQRGLAACGNAARTPIIERSMLEEARRLGAKPEQTLNLRRRIASLLIPEANQLLPYREHATPLTETRFEHEREILKAAEQE